MRHLLFTVRDLKADCYVVPFTDKTRAAAIRMFIDTVNAPDHTFNKHPEDFVLYELGTFDDNRAEFELSDTPIPIAKAIEMLKPMETTPLEKAIENA